MPNKILPTLPQNDTQEMQDQRAFQLSLARTKYNYMTSYLEGVPLSADVPKGEEFSLQYKEGVLSVFFQLAENFKSNVLRLLEKELCGDIDSDIFNEIKTTYEKLESDHNGGFLNKLHEPHDLKMFLKSLSKLPTAMEDAFNLPKDLMKMLKGIDAVIEEVKEEGPTALLKSTLYDLLNNDGKRDYLQATSLEDYKALYQYLDTPPLTVTLKRKPWMSDKTELYQQDWYFGYLQTAGFNTTNLLAVSSHKELDSCAISLEELLKKMPITDSILQSVVNNPEISLQSAAAKKRLYVCDYTMLDGKKSNKLHGKQRYVCAPIALFYWCTDNAEGYPDSGGFLRPIAIQLDQKHDKNTTPIFTPNNCSNSNDRNGLKWQIAKTIVNICSAIQHENVAHLGACHLIMDTIIISANRQLSKQHPILQLLTPHFRFTLNINNDALHSLVIPGGVTACDVGLTTESSFEMIAEARKAWSWDEQSPDNLFKARGVDQGALPVFEFRDDTLLLWKSIKEFVREYLSIYYKNDDSAVEKDTELQHFINELVSPKYGDFKGLNGLKRTESGEQPYKVDSFEYLIDVISHIIYIAGPQHAAVNYAQYPLMSYAPSVTGCLYNEPPGTDTIVNTIEDTLTWCPPLDIALYTLSFEYLLSGVQYDEFGKYSKDPRIAYFSDPAVEEILEDFQCKLAQTEIEIHQRNKTRAVPYTFQLPSRIPNSTSI